MMTYHQKVDQYLAKIRVIGRQLGRNYDQRLRIEMALRLRLKLATRADYFAERERESAY